jgi:hypothetical protein
MGPSPTGTRTDTRPDNRVVWPVDIGIRCSIRPFREENKFVFRELVSNSDDTPDKRLRYLPMEQVAHTHGKDPTRAVWIAKLKGFIESVIVCHDYAFGVLLCPLVSRHILRRIVTFRLSAHEFLSPAIRTLRAVS